MSDIETYYEVLEIADTATPDEIRAAYRALVHQYHPDKVPAHLTKLKKDAEERFRQIDEAYKALKDVVKRAQYDEMLRQLREESPDPAPNGHPSAASAQRPAPGSASGAGSHATVRRENPLRLVPPWLLAGIAIAFCYWGYLFFANTAQSTARTSRKPSQSATRNATEGYNGATKGNPFDFAYTEKEYVLSWTLPRGHAIDGQNSAGPFPAEIIKLDEEIFWIDISYKVNGVKEVAKYRLRKVYENYWSGTWKQSNPVNSGTCELRKEGNYLWVGQFTSANDPGKSPRVTIKRK